MDQVLKRKLFLITTSDDFLPVAQEYVDKFKTGGASHVKIKIFVEMMYFLSIVKYNWTQHTKLVSVILNKIRMIKEHYIVRTVPEPVWSAEGNKIVKELLKCYKARVDNTLLINPCINITNSGCQCSRICTSHVSPPDGTILEYMCTQHRKLCIIKTRRICQVLYDQLPVDIIHLIINVYCEMNVCSVNVPCLR